ncbi:MAG: hypothetical protein ABFD54_11735 [Armatimonadota bacterium]|nr:hypothetical protein [bacterium]
MQDDSNAEIQQLTVVLSQLASLLRRTGHPRDTERADDIESVISLLTTDKAKAIEELVSNTFWGGAGSYIDEGINCSGNEVDHRNAYREYRQLLLELLVNLRAQGHTHRWFDDREELLRHWIRNPDDEIVIIRHPS